MDKNEVYSWVTDENNLGSHYLTDNLPTQSPSLTDLEKIDFLQPDYIFGENKTKTIERLEEKIVSEKRSTSLANNRYETEKEEKYKIMKKYAKLEKQIKKIARERDLLKFDLKITKHQIRNLNR